MLNDNEKYQAQINEGIKAEMFLAGVMDGIKAGEMVSSLVQKRCWARRNSAVPGFIP